MLIVQELDLPVLAPDGRWSPLAAIVDCEFEPNCRFTSKESVATAPPSESLRDELLAVVRNEVLGSLSCPPEGIFKKSLDCG